MYQCVPAVAHEPTESQLHWLPGIRAVKKRLRTITSVFLITVSVMLTGGAAWLIAFDPESYYKPPYYCEVLWCQHDTMPASDGREVCAKYPPREIMRTRVSVATKAVRLMAAFLTGTLGLACAAFPAMVGLAWLRETWKPQHVLRWTLIALGIGFIASPILVLATVWLKALYGFVPR